MTERNKRRKEATTAKENEFDYCAHIAKHLSALIRSRHGGST
jgi:hypothetical protein